MRTQHVYMVLVTLLISFSILPANAAGPGFWGLRRVFSGRTDVSFDDTVEVIYTYLQDPRSTPHHDVRRDLQSHYKSMFGPPAVEMKFRSERLLSSKRHPVATGVIYFSKGELIVRYSSCDLRYEQYPMNYITKGGKLYEWRFGDRSGRILTRYVGDTVELLDYIIDPAMLKRFMYTEFQKEPSDWDEQSSDSENLYFPVRREEMKSAGLVSVGVSKDSFWLRSLTYHKPSDAGAGDIIAVIEPPTRVESIPVELREIPPDIEFKAVPLTAEWRLLYW